MILKKTFKPDKNIPITILGIGLLLFIGGIIVAFVYQYQFLHITNDSVQTPLYKKLLSFSPVFTLFFPIIMAPIVEEFIFRFWVKSKNYAYYFTLVGIILFSYLTCKDFKITGSVLLILTASLFIKNNKIKIWTMTLLTSLLFGFLHLKNYVSSTFTIIACIQLVGFGMILSYIGLRFNFIYCIIIHSVYNLIAILPIMISFESDLLPLNGKSFDATIEHVSIFTLSNKQDIIKNDTISITAIPVEIATKLNNFNKDTLYDYLIQGQLVKKHLLAISKTDTQIDKKELLDNILKQFNIQSDTSLIQAYTLSVVDLDKLRKTFVGNNYFLISLTGLVQSMRSKYDIPLILDDDFDDIIIEMDYKFIRLKDIEDISHFLLEKYGIFITQNNDKKAVIISYY